MGLCKAKDNLRKYRTSEVKHEMTSRHHNSAFLPIHSVHISGQSRDYLLASTRIKKPSLGVAPDWTSLSPARQDNASSLASAHSNLALNLLRFDLLNYGLLTWLTAATRRASAAYLMAWIKDNLEAASHGHAGVDRWCMLQEGQGPPLPLHQFM